MNNDHRRSNAEIDEIGEAVELGSESGLRFQKRGRARPSMPSRRAAKAMPASARSQRPSIDMRMEVSPAHSPSSVKKFGTNIRTGMLAVAKQQPPPPPHGFLPPASADWIHRPAPFEV